jgi:hypothetical protein
MEELGNNSADNDEPENVHFALQVLAIRRTSQKRFCSRPGALEQRKLWTRLPDRLAKPRRNT